MMGFRIMWYDRWVSFRELGFKMSSEVQRLLEVFSLLSLLAWILALYVSLRVAALGLRVWDPYMGHCRDLASLTWTSLQVGRRAPKPLGNLRERKAIQTLLTYFLEDTPFTDHSDLRPALAVPMGYPSTICSLLQTPPSIFTIQKAWGKMIVDNQSKLLKKRWWSQSS